MAVLSDVRNAIKAELIIGSTDYDAQIDNAIRAAIASLRGEMLWFLRATTTISFSAGFNSASLPSDYDCGGKYSLVYSGRRYTDSYDFINMGYDEMESTYFSSSPIPTGRPVACAEYGDALYLSHLAPSALTVDMRYYKKDATLPMSGSDTSVWFSDGYEVVRASALLFFKQGASEFTPTQLDIQNVNFFKSTIYAVHRARDGFR